MGLSFPMVLTTVAIIVTEYICVFYLFNVTKANISKNTLQNKFLCTFFQKNILSNKKGK